MSLLVAAALDGYDCPFRDDKLSARKEPLMAPSTRSVLVVNVLFWVVGAMLHPLASLMPTGSSGEPPKVFSLLIPIVFLLLAFGSTAMIARALGQQKDQ